MVLVDKPGQGILPPQLENYLARNTYIEAQDYVEAMDAIREKIRCAMPNIPLKQLKVSWNESTFQIQCPFIKK